MVLSCLFTPQLSPFSTSLWGREMSLSSLRSTFFRYHRWKRYKNVALLTPVAMWLLLTLMRYLILPYTTSTWRTFRFLLSRSGLCTCIMRIPNTSIPASIPLGIFGLSSIPGHLHGMPTSRIHQVWRLCRQPQAPEHFLSVSVGRFQAFWFEILGSGLLVRRVLHTQPPDDLHGREFLTLFQHYEVQFHQLRLKCSRMIACKDFEWMRMLQFLCMTPALTLFLTSVFPNEESHCRLRIVRAFSSDALCRSNVAIKIRKTCKDGLVLH